MACSFRGAGSPSYSLEIQWWYIKDRRDWQEQPAQITNDVSCEEKSLSQQGCTSSVAMGYLESSAN